LNGEEEEERSNLRLTRRQAEQTIIRTLVKRQLIGLF
jgi:hypothetical protein